MRRAVIILLAVAAAVAALGVGSCGDDGDKYEVRAIFDNASFLVNGEDVRIAGAKVGSVASVDITTTDEPAREDGQPAPGKAAVTMQITDPAFQDFRVDASCLIRPQSLIGEKFVDCTPTEPRAPGTPAPPELAEIPDGEPGAGQFLLPLERNGKAVDLDLVNNIMKEPYPDRFRLILNDLGAGLAARGDELAEIVERSNPALRETNKVLAILRQQNQDLADLASDGDRVITALAREREHVAGFINASTEVGQATAERQADLEAGFAKLPQFLRELRSTMGELSSFSDAATPVFARLGQAAPSLTKLNQLTIPFSSAATDSIVSLGNSTEISGPALAASDPVIRQVRGIAQEGAPATKNLAKLLRSFRKTNGIKFLMKTLFGLGGAVNGYDQFGHLVRALVPLQNCFDYTSIPQSGCSAKFSTTPLSAAAKQQREQNRKPNRQRYRNGRDGGSAGQDEPSVDAAPQPAPDAAPPETTTPQPDSETQPPLGVEPAPTAPETTPDPAAPGEVQVQPGAAKRLLDFLIGDRHHRHRGGKR